ncbi:MAG: hypothetical protein KatS3mg115_0329 [Candidatus Poribacteria bacterium]|nr:MAG: hypothetical protein KatS3mg115_0329 [Candidatus Poribacteria bacterium]
MSSREPVPLEELIGYLFKDLRWLEAALRHRSAARSSHPEEEPLHEPDNERLEFLGDAVFDLVVRELLFKRFPNASEGHLARWRGGT